MTAYIKKEWMELLRTKRLLILSILFFLFGVLNPATAKLTPWIYDMMKDTMAEQGLMVGTLTVTAMTSWEQFFKNAMMVIIVMILMSSNGFTGEYQKGTLVQVVTKGLSRRKIYFAKLFMGYATWTAMFVIYAGVTFGYNAYFWRGETVPDLLFGMIMLWLLGMLVMSMLCMFGALASSSGQVLLGTGGILFLSMLLGYIPTIEKYLPLKLSDGLSLCKGAARISDFSGSIITSSIMMVLCVIIGMIAFDRRKL